MSQKHKCGHSDMVCDECHDSLFHFGQTSNKKEIRELIDMTRNITIKSIINVLDKRSAKYISKTELQELLNQLVTEEKRDMAIIDILHGEE